MATLEGVGKGSTPLNFHLIRKYRAGNLAVYCRRCLFRCRWSGRENFVYLKIAVSWPG